MPQLVTDFGCADSYELIYENLGNLREVFG